jgi:DUF2911 family protein
MALMKNGVLACCLATFVVAGTNACAQSNPRPSQHGSVTQRVADTQIEVQYFRPVARGRDLFPGVVRWGRTWTPGADTATTISVSTDVKVNGQTLPAGTYSLWCEPEPDKWTIIFNKVQPVFHTMYPSGQDVLRVTATPRKGEHMETLAFYFPVVDGRKAELVIHWGTVVVPLAIEVP